MSSPSPSSSRPSPSPSSRISAWTVLKVGLAAVTAYNFGWIVRQHAKLLNVEGSMDVETMALVMNDVGAAPKKCLPYAQCVRQISEEKLLRSFVLM